MSVKITGSMDLGDLMKKVESTAKNSSGDVNFDRLFNQGFVARETRYDTFQELLLLNGISEEELDNFYDLDDERIDKIIREQTRFSSWQEFAQKATNEYYIEEFEKVGIPLHEK